MTPARPEKAPRRVGDLMTREVQTCRPGDALAVAVRIMRDRKCGFVPVTDSEGRVAGVVTDRDVCLAVLLWDVSLHALRVEQAMTTEVLTAHSFDSIEDAERSMRSWRVRRLPVIDEAGKLIGVLSLDDLAARASAEPAEPTQIARTLGTIARPPRVIDLPG